MKKIVLFLLAFTVLSCSSDESETTQSDEPILIKRIAYSGGSSSDPSDVVYTYDGTKMVSAVVDNSMTLSYIYEGNYVTRINSYNQNNLLTNYFINGYENGRLISRKHIIPVADQGFRSEYTYNSDGTVSVANFSGNEFVQNDTENPGKLYFGASGEIIKYEQYAGNGTVTSTYFHDNKNNPYKNVTGFDKMLNSTGSFHNVTSEITIGADGSQSVETSHEFLYNEFDYPKSAVRTQNGSETIILYYYQ